MNAQLIEEAHQWVSPEELEQLKEQFRPLAKSSRGGSMIKLIAALDRCYKAATHQ